VRAIQVALADNPRAETFVYPGVAHGFTMATRLAYNEDASESSFERALAVLNCLK
jgi:dienelactone hydrolase